MVGYSVRFLLKDSTIAQVESLTEFSLINVPAGELSAIIGA
jgi:hypothetical protein